MINLEEIVKLQKQGDFKKAKNLYLKILKKDPSNFKVLALLGATLLQSKEYDQAIRFLQKAAQINSNIPSIYNNLSVALMMTQNYSESIINLKKALNLNNKYYGAYNNLATNFRILRKYKDAFDNYKKAIQLNPDYYEAYNNLGLLYLQTYKYDECIKCFDKAIKLKTDYIEAYKNKASAHTLFKNYNLAIMDYEALKKLDQKNIILYNINILFNKIMICDWENFEELSSYLKKNIQKINLPPFNFLYLIDDLKLIKSWTKIFNNQSNPINTSKNININFNETKKIILGYYSADFKEHALSRLIVSVLENHNKNDFEIIGFNFSERNDDDMTNRIKKSFNKFYDVREFSDQELINFSQKLKIDIAIDLSGYMRSNRSNIFRQGVAPIQINYLGYPGTLGTQWDYIIADRNLIPPESQKFYFEKIIYMPDCYQPNDSNFIFKKHSYQFKEFELIKSKFIFCCLNTCSKINPSIFNSWMNILRKTQNSVLCLLKSNEIMEKNLINEASRRGIDSNRIVFVPYLGPNDYEKYLQRFKFFDLFLDTFPCSAHTTASDALSNGLPIITLYGKSFQSRVALSLLKNLKLDELIMKNIKEYEDYAIAAASKPNKLSHIKKKLLFQKNNNNFFSAKIYTNNLEKGYKTVHQMLLKKIPPSHIYI
jgi:predicted O-linked N-acetylglucosamine transferase (SPINDLY family)